MTDVRIKDIKTRLLNELKDHYDDNELLHLVNYLLDSVTGLNRLNLHISQDQILEPAKVEQLLEGLEQLKQYKPVQYITGKAWFSGMELLVNPHVLIPRPETEELVSWIVDDQKSSQGLKVMDIGTGSGCIIIALGKMMWQPLLHAMDKSVEALNVAVDNASLLQVKVSFILADILDRKSWNDLTSYDLVVSNPPYVREMEKRMMKTNVLDYEPHLALFVADDDPLVFYRAIAAFAREKLNQNGKAYLEINEYIADETIRLFEEEGFGNILLKKDLQGKSRMLRVGV